MIRLLSSAKAVRQSWKMSRAQRIQRFMSFLFRTKPQWAQGNRRTSLVWRVCTKNATFRRGNWTREYLAGVKRATIFDLGEVCMAARQVILYFEDQKDALRFALAAGSIMARDGGTEAGEERTLIQ